MKNMQSTRPTSGKRSLHMGDIKDKLIRVSTDVTKETYKKIKQRPLDEERGILEMLKSVLEREFK